jgi:polyphosphate glucokinase
MRQQDGDAPPLAPPLTLCIDVGGSHVKAANVAADGEIVGEAVRARTPAGEGPAAIVGAIAALVAPLAPAGRVSVGFPGAVRDGVVLTAPNIGGRAWRGVRLAEWLRERLGRPVRLANDATVQGLGAISGAGIECAITLGTGMGFAVFDHGRPGVHLELGRHVARKGKSYDRYVGEAALEKVGARHWNRRVADAIERLRRLVNFDTLYVGGGNARLISFGLPPDVHIVSNATGIVGGVRLWDGLPRTLAAAAARRPDPDPRPGGFAS